MSYICEFCGVRPEKCNCFVHLTEPSMESELAVANNMMTLENTNIQKPYGLVDAPSATAFFSLLVELENQETDVELGPEPKWMMQCNNQDDPLIRRETIQTTPRKLIHEFPEEDAYLEYLKKPQSAEYLKLSERLNNLGSYEEFCDVMNKMKDLYDLETSLPTYHDEIPIIEYCETCYDFSCECDKMVHCECGALYHIDEPYQMCCSCEATTTHLQSAP